MTQLGWQVVALALLVGALALGEFLLRRRGRPSAAERMVLLTLVGGLLGAPFWWRGDSAAFAWALPPLAGRMLAAAGWAFALACLVALRRRGGGQFRLVGWMLAVYLGPLTAAILLLHLDRMDFGAAVTWAFFAIVVLLLLAAAWLVRLPAPRDAPAPDRATGAVLAVVGTIAAGWGAALFVWPDGPLPQLWLWPADPLTSRLIASMFLTVAAACLVARNSAALGSTVLATVAVYGVGISLAALANLAAGKPLPTAYVAFWLLAAVTASGALLRGRAAARASGAAAGS